MGVVAKVASKSVANLQEIKMSMLQPGCALSDPDMVAEARLPPSWLPPLPWR